MGSNGKVAAERAPDRQGAETLFLREAASHPAQKSRHCLESDLREESRAWTEARPRPRPLPLPGPSAPPSPHPRPAGPPVQEAGGGAGRSRAGRGAQGQRAALPRPPPSRDSRFPGSPGMRRTPHPAQRAHPPPTACAPRSVPLLWGGF